MSESRGVFLSGGGGHGLVVLDSLLDLGFTVSGILDPALPVGTTLFDVPVLGGDDWLDQVEPSTTLLANGIGANPGVGPRWRLFRAMKEKGFRFLDLRHPSSFLGRLSSVGEGCQLMAGATVQCGVSIAENVVVNTGASIDHDCQIGAHSFVGPGAVLCAAVVLEEQVFLGAGAVLLPEVRIGAGTIVGAGSVVTRAIPPGLIVAGNPARELGKRSP